jgi:hypothetical protein
MQIAKARKRAEENDAAASSKRTLQKMFEALATYFFAQLSPAFVHSGLIFIFQSRTKRADRFSDNRTLFEGTAKNGIVSRIPVP